MNLFPPELAPLMLASPEGAPVASAGMILGACVAGVLVRGIKPNKAYSVACSGVALWVVSRDFGIPLDALVFAAGPQFALPCTVGDAWVGYFGLAQYVFLSSPASPPQDFVHIAWVAILAFLYVVNAADATFGIARSCIVGLWFTYPRIAHISSGAMIAGCAVTGMPGVLAALGSMLSMAILGSYAPMVLGIFGCICFCFTI
jgi:hypothetical protein